MNETSFEEGYRILVKMDSLSTNFPRKCYIFIDTKHWCKIENLKKHVKRLFDINQEIDIFVGDVLLPDGERISLIERGDDLNVKLSQRKLESPSKKNIEEEANLLKESKKKKKIKKSKKAQHVNDVIIDIASEITGIEETPSSPITTDLDNCFQELHKKRRKLIEQNCLPKESENESIINSMQDDSLLSPIKKKRKRKHKKKTPKETVEQAEDNVVHLQPTINTSIERLSDSSMSSKHIRFSQDEETEQADDEMEPADGSLSGEFKYKAEGQVNGDFGEEVCSQKRSVGNCFSKVPVAVKRKRKKSKSSSTDIKEDREKLVVGSQVTKEFHEKIDDLKLMVIGLAAQHNADKIFSRQDPKKVISLNHFYKENNTSSLQNPKMENDIRKDNIDCTSNSLKGKMLNRSCSPQTLSQVHVGEVSDGADTSTCLQGESPSSNSDSYSKQLNCKVGDVISFKKVKLGDDYCPGMSNEIVAEVIGHNKSGHIILNIRSGFEEFKTPSGKFSLGKENDEPEEDEIESIEKIVELHFSELLDLSIKVPFGSP